MLNTQKALLSQGVRAMLRIIEYVSKSLKVIRNGILSRACVNPIATTSPSRTVSEIFSVKKWRDLEIWVNGRLRSLKMVQFESSGTVSYSHSIATLTVSLAVST